MLLLYLFSNTMSSVRYLTLTSSVACGTWLKVIEETLELVATVYAFVCCTTPFSVTIILSTVAISFRA